MNIFKQLFKVLQSFLHAFVNHIQDPILMAEQAIRDLKKDYDASMKNLAEVKRCFHDRNQKVWQLREENNSTALHRSVFMNSEPMTKLIIEELKKRLGFDDKGGLEKFIKMCYTMVEKAEEVIL